MHISFFVCGGGGGWGVNAGKPSSVAPHASFAWPTLYVALKIGTHQSK